MEDRTNRSHRPAWEGDDIGDFRDELAAWRDEEAKDRDEKAKERDRNATRRDQESIVRGLHIRDRFRARKESHLAEQLIRTAQLQQDGDQRASFDDEGMARFLEQTTIDQESGASERESDEAELVALLNAMEMDRLAAAEDRRGARRDREKAAGDRREADDDRRYAAGDRQQAEIERNQAEID